MLYNFEKQKIKTNVDCLSCKWFDKKNKKCTGIGKVCFEYDAKLKIAFDPVTKLPINLNKMKKGE